MAEMKSYFFLIAVVIVVVIQSTFSASIMRKRDVNDHKNVTTLIEDVRATLSNLKEIWHNSNPFLHLNRRRRNTAQWYVGSHHFNDYNHDRASRRWTHRRHSTHHHGRGQLVDA